ncbi:MAG: hypothetical protein HY815_09665 [Candidatus Riflebacteria bacterium]|nr:hypothetical protein [Candidatus Riflebacteria bacterium]
MSRAAGRPGGLEGGKMTDLVCAVDAGTTRIKAALVDSTGRVRRLAAAPTPSSSPGRALPDVDARACADLTCDLIRSALRKGSISPRRVKALVVTGQRATVVPLDRAGDPAGPGLSWQDTRCAPALERFHSRLGARRFSRITGLPPSALWTLGKILWLKEATDGAARSTLRFALLVDYLLSRLGTRDLVTDRSHASLTGLLDLATSAWSDEILAAARVDPSQLPALVQSGSIVGRLSRSAATATGLEEGTALVAGGGDQQCAALAVGALQPGVASLCLGTAAVLSCPVTRPVRDRSGRSFCTVHVIDGRWMLEGIHNTFGSALNWARRLLGLTSSRAFMRCAAGGAPGSSGATFLPFLAGIGSPDYDASRRGALLGLGLSTGRSDVARAVLEGVCLEVRRIVDSLERHVRIERLIVSGGASIQRSVASMLAGLTGRTVVVQREPETTLLGAAMLAWTAIGRFSDPAAAFLELGGSPGRPMRPADPAGSDILNRRYLRQLHELRSRGGPAAPGEGAA